jgi:hypothetical protein
VATEAWLSAHFSEIVEIAIITWICDKMLKMLSSAIHNTTKRALFYIFVFQSGCKSSVGISILRMLLHGKIPEIVPVDTFKMLVATCSDWRQGWTTLV